MQCLKYAMRLDHNLPVKKTFLFHCLLDDDRQLAVRGKVTDERCALRSRDYTGYIIEIRFCCESKLIGKVKEL